MKSPSIFKKIVHAVIASVLVNLVFIFVVKFLVHPPATFSPFFYSLIALYTALGVIGAGIVYVIIKKVTPKYNKVFIRISVLALILSLIPDIGLYTSPGADDIGATIPIVIILMLTHIYAAFIVVKMLTNEK